MKKIARVVGLGLLVFLVPQFATAQNELFAGTWKANVAKSTYQPGPGPTREILRFEAVGGGIRFGGGDVPVLAAPARQARFTYAFSRIDAHTWEIVIKVNGERRILVRNVVSADGQTMTSVSTAVTNQGQTASQVVIYEKQ